ncbi:hypothetical protein AAGG42_23510, partial [Stenotrophomonas maltophilia]|uniref:hypothetical protein n=1 Tax=Stenotrophomonas maltophilia TaxID=40324 RepID=UPI0031452B82
TPYPPNSSTAPPSAPEPTRKFLSDNPNPTRRGPYPKHHKKPTDQKNTHPETKHPIPKHPIKKIKPPRKQTQQPKPQKPQHAKPQQKHNIYKSPKNAAI